MLESGSPVVKQEFHERNNSRIVRLPVGLTEQEMINLKPAEIDQLIRQAGPIVGYAAMFKLAGGGADTPPSIQYHAAKFLVERAGDLESEARQDGRTRGLENLTPEQLDALINDLERGGAHLSPPPDDA